MEGRCELCGATEVCDRCAGSWTETSADTDEQDINKRESNETRNIETS